MGKEKCLHPAMNARINRKRRESNSHERPAERRKEGGRRKSEENGLRSHQKQATGESTRGEGGEGERGEKSGESPKSDVRGTGKPFRVLSVVKRAGNMQREKTAKRGMGRWKGEVGR